MSVPGGPHIDGLWHSTAMGASYDALFGPLCTLFGAVVMHDQVSDDPAVGRRGGMVWVGDNSIELGEPVGEHSPVRGFVEKLGGGMHSLALRVPDAAAARERLAAAGAPAAAFIGDDVFFTRPGDSHGLMLEWSAMHTDDDPRFGYPLPEPSSPSVAPLAPAVRYGFVTAAVADPTAAAQRLAELFGTEVLRSTPGAGPGEIGALVSLGDCVLVLVALPATPGDWPWAQPPTRARFHGHGLEVDDLPAALAALEAAGVGVAARLEHAVLLDPAATAVPTFLSGHGFPEDPRQG
jgi:catechol 2,3-dioxygenase-like lactoylglutathione lyase family enzyme